MSLWAEARRSGRWERKTRGPRAVPAREPVVPEARSSVHARRGRPSSSADEAQARSARCGRRRDAAGRGTGAAEDIRAPQNPSLVWIGGCAGSGRPRARRVNVPHWDHTKSCAARIGARWRRAASGA